MQFCLRVNADTYMQRTVIKNYHHHHQVPGLMALAIMSFQRSRSRAADIISVTLPAPNQDFGLSSIFSLCLPLLLFLSSLPVVRKCSKPSLLITWPKNVACCFLIFCISDLLVSASFNTFSFVFFAVHGMHNILLRNHISSTASNLL